MNNTLRTSFYHVFASLPALLLAAGLLVAPAARAQAPGWQGATAIGNSTNQTSSNGINAMATDAGGNVYVTGTFYDRAVFNNTPITSQADGSGFLAKWSPITRQFIWVIDFGGAQGVVTPLALAVNGPDVYVAGGFTTTGLNWGPTGTYVANPGGANYTSEGFVAKLTDYGNTLSYGWLQRVGGTGYDRIEGLAVSGSNVYVAGTFSGPTARFGATSLASLGSRDGFVAKLTDAGATSSVGWVQRLGGTGVEEGHKVATVNSNVYVTGTTTGTVTLGSTTLSSTGGTDGFVAKLTDSGSNASFGWVQALQGIGNEVALDVVASGPAVYVAGSFTSLAASFGSSTLRSAGGLDGVVARLTDAGSTASVTWAQRFGGTLDDEPQALAVVGGKVYVAGYFSSGSPIGGGPPAAFGSTQLQAAGGSDAFLTRLTDAGTVGQFDWAQQAGSPADDYANAVTLNGITPCVGGFFTGNRFAIGTTTLSNLHTGSATSFVASLTDPVLPTRNAALEEDLTLYPNPARATITLRVPTAAGAGAKLTLLNALGQAVRTQAAVGGKEVVVDLTGLAAGLYALRVQAGDAVAIRRLTIE